MHRIKVNISVKSDHCWHLIYSSKHQRLHSRRRLKGRLMNCYRFALVYFRCFGNPEYAYPVFKMFHRIKLEPQSAFRLIWSRFINTVGVKGRNISRDLHLDHVNNNQPKQLLRSLQSNLNEINARRVTSSLKNLTDIINNLERSSNVTRTTSNKSFKKLVWCQNS